MKTKPVAKPWAKPWGTDAVGLMPICIGFYLVADLLLISLAWFLENDRLLVAMALPLSQCSLAAVWAARSRASLYVRFAVPPVAAVTCWYVLSQILPWGIGEPASSAWAIALAVQTLAIVIAINLYINVRDLTARREAGATRQSRSPFTFNLLTLILWTTVIALGFGFVQFGRVKLGWTANVTDWDFFEIMPVIGVFNALLALLWLWAFTVGGRTWRGVKIAIVLLLTGLLGYSLSYLLGWTIGAPAIGLRETLVLAAAQSFFLASSLAVVLAGDSKRRQSVAPE